MLTTSPELTDDQWSRISALLPPQRPPIGRPSEDHRTILAGMLWIVRTGSAWRELPSTFGPWPTVYSHFRRWRQAGLWQRILDTLDSSMLSGSSEVSL